MKIYKQLDEYPEYLFCNDGTILSTKYNKRRILKPSITQRGYYCYRLKNNQGNFITKMGHRLIAKAFLNNYSDKLQVDHVDGNKLNNAVNNLEMVTASVNMKRSFELDLHVPPKLFGSKNARSKKVTLLTPDKTYITFSSIEECITYLKIGRTIFRRHVKSKKPIKGYSIIL